MIENWPRDIQTAAVVARRKRRTEAGADRVGNLAAAAGFAAAEVVARLDDPCGQHDGINGLDRRDRQIRSGAELNVFARRRHHLRGERFGLALAAVQDRALVKRRKPLDLDGPADAAEGVGSDAVEKLGVNRIEAVVKGDGLNINICPQN